MDLDFDKYCVVDGSPTTVLQAPRRRSKVSNRKSNGKPKCGSELLSLKEGFNEIRLNHYRSASCRDASSRILKPEGNEVLKRGSVYESSRDVRLLKKTEGRQKIEFSRGSASALSFGIIDSLCSDEDSSLMDHNRSSVMSFSEQDTSSVCQSQTELHSQDFLNCSFPFIPKRSVGPNVASIEFDNRKNEYVENGDSQLVQDPIIASEPAVCPVNDGNNPQERNVDVNLYKSLSAKLAFSHSRAQSANYSPKANCPKARFTHSKKMFDPFVKSKLHKSPLSSANDTGWEIKKGLADINLKQTVCDSDIMNELSNKPQRKEYISQFEKKENYNSVLHSSPAHLHGLLKLDNKHGVPVFEFTVKSLQDVYVVKTKKVENALTWVYTFHSFHSKRKINASGWGLKDNNKESSVVGQMEVSCYLHTELKGDAGALNNSMVTEFVLSDVSHSRKSISSRDNSKCSSNVKAPVVSDEILSWDNCDCCPFQSSASCRPAPVNLHPELEIAAIIMQVPFEKRESLQFKGGDGIVDKTLTNLLELCHIEQKKDCKSDASSLGKMHVVIPAGNHSMPIADSHGPSPLLDRWRLGGGCDCGGWDIACPINIFGNEKIQIARGLMDNQHPAELFVQGRNDKMPAFTMRVIEDGKYAVDFHAQLSSLQAFSIGVAILHTAEASTSFVQESSKQMLQCDSLRVFAGEEIKNLIDGIPEEERFEVNKKMEEVPPSFVLNPPFSPISRV